MAEETKIAMKLEKELEPIKKMCETLEDAAKHELSKGIENVDAKELGEVVDMIKDLYEAKEKIVKACYYKGILEAMEEHDFDDEEDIMDEGRRGYRGQPRNSKGQYMSRRGYEAPMMMQDDREYYRDMDRMDGKMYYTSGNSSMGGSTSGQSGSSSMNSGQMGYSESRYDRARRGYEEAKSMHKDNSSEGKQMKMKSLEDYMKELSSDVSSMITDMTPEEKSLMRTKLQTLAQKVS